MAYNLVIKVRNKLRLNKIKAANIKAHEQLKAAKLHE